MNRDDILIRPAGPNDVSQVAAIVREENPAWVFSDRGWQHRWESTPTRARMLALVAVGGREVVGHGGCGLSTTTSIEGASVT